MIIVDTGFWLALADENDDFHQASKSALTRYKEPLITTEYLGQGRIFSVDQRDFNTYRWKNKHPFENLLFL